MPQVPGEKCGTETVVGDLRDGIVVGEVTVCARTITPGRFREEENVEIAVRAAEHEAALLTAKIFHGRGAHYKPWVELFHIRPSVRLGDETVAYFDSSLEDRLLALFCEAVGPGGKIFVEYGEDLETAKQLEAGFPPPLTRLGNKLFRCGCTWFRDWYFPEGFLEGGQKLQGNRPADETARLHHLQRTAEELQAFLALADALDPKIPHRDRAIARARHVLDQLRGEGL